VRRLAAPTLRQSLAGFVVLAQKTAQTKLTYRLATLITLLSSGCAYCVFLLVWREVYRRDPHAGPLSREQMMAYLVMAFLVNSALIMNVETRFLQRVRMGLVTGDLLRPLSFVFFQMAQATGDVAVNVVFAAPIYAAGLLFAGGALSPASPLAAVLGALSLALAFFIAFGVSYLLVQASFVLQSGYGIFFARAALHQVFSGLSAPLVLFPPSLRRVAEWLPFRCEVETPVRLWLGYAEVADAPLLLAEQAAWGLGLLVTGELVFRAVMRHHQVQGG
jgi:ABC-2 type transport system permease protein